jgi:plastocyanin
MAWRTITGTAAALLAAASLACGGDSPTSPGDGGDDSPGPVGATLTITPNGMNPGTVTIAAGQSITLTNNDTRGHEISSDPHPVHSDCQSMNIGQLSAGQSRTSSAFTAARTCTYHDHDDPDNPLWKGTVVVQ